MPFYDEKAQKVEIFIYNLFFSIRHDPIQGISLKGDYNS
jgi:hypothetical protein